MKKIFMALCMVAFLVACDDSSSASVENNEPTTLSSAEEQGSLSSSSVTSADSEILSSSRHCEECSDEAISSSIAELKEANSSSSSKKNAVSSSSEKLSEPGSSSAIKVVLLSSGSDVPQGSIEAKVMPSGTYNCTKYKCVTTEYLNKNKKYGEILDVRDGQVYKTVEIGNQVWMAQNLNYADSGKTPSLLKNSWCFENELDSCAKYGRLYTWAAAIDSVALATDKDKPQECGYGKNCTLPLMWRGICPEGWHLPMKGDWNDLFRFGGSTAGIFKISPGWRMFDLGTDDFGFSALPAGYRDSEGLFNDDHCHANFWSSDEDSDGEFAEYMTLRCFADNALLMVDGPKNDAYSVRCVKNQESVFGYRDLVANP